MKNRKAVKYLYNVNPFYIFCKKHYCLHCGERLKTVYESVIVNSASPEAKNYNFAIGAGDNYYKGDVEFRIGFFRCYKCNVKIRLDKYKNLKNRIIKQQ